MAKKKYNFSTKHMDVRLTTNFSSIEFTLKEIPKGTLKIAQKHLAKKKNSLAKALIKETQKVIKEGGTNYSGMVWTYWERVRGEKNFRPVNGSRKITSFSTTFKYGSKVRLRYPIHPRSYWIYRKHRKKPVKGQFALYDSGKMFRSLRVSSCTKKNRVYVKIMSSKKILIQKHEKGWSVQNGRVKRPVIQPAWLRITQSPKYKNMMNEIILDTHKMIEGLKRRA